MKNFFSLKFLLLGLTFMLAIPSFAQLDCNALLQGRGPNYMKKNIFIAEDVKVKDKAIKTIIATRVKKITGEEFTGSTFDEAIEAVFKKINASEKTALDKADQLGKFGREMNDVFEEMIAKYPAKGTLDEPDLAAWILRKEAIDEVKSIKYQIVKKITKLENFSASDYITVPKEDFVMTQGNNFTQLTHMKMKDYPKYVESYLYGLSSPNSVKAKLFNKIDEGSLGILSLSDIRDITSYNLWPMYYKSHDIRHVHFAISHPMALAAMMGSTRSKNHLRYVMMGGLYEGVDRVQYSHETQLNKFFATQIASDEVFGIKRNLDLEEAMLMVASAPTADLKKIAKASGAKVTMDGFLTGLGDWKPKKVSGHLNGKAIDGESLDKEIDDMVKEFTSMIQRADDIKKKLFKKPDARLTREEERFMKLMNYQLDPLNPEIEIDGVRFKNDGRAHHYGGDGQATIGIGDQ